MVRAILIFAAVGISVTSAQEKQKEDHPCKAPIIQKVKENGMRSLKVWEVPLFYWHRQKCRKAINNSAYLTKVIEDQHEADYEASKSLQGFTSCVAYCAIASVFIFLVSASL